MSPYVDPPTIPEGQSCAEYRHRRQPESQRGPWTRTAARVLAVALYQMGFITAQHRDGSL